MPYAYHQTITEALLVVVMDLIGVPGRWPVRICVVGAMDV